MTVCKGAFAVNSVAETTSVVIEHDVPRVLSVSVSNESVLNYFKPMQYLLLVLVFLWPL